MSACDQWYIVQYWYSVLSLSVANASIFHFNNLLDSSQFFVVVFDKRWNAGASSCWMWTGKNWRKWKCNKLFLPFYANSIQLVRRRGIQRWRSNDFFLKKNWFPSRSMTEPHRNMEHEVIVGLQLMAKHVQVLSSALRIVLALQWNVCKDNNLSETYLHHLLERCRQFIYSTQSN